MARGEYSRRRSTEQRGPGFVEFSHCSKCLLSVTCWKVTFMGTNSTCSGHGFSAFIGSSYSNVSIPFKIFWVRSIIFMVQEFLINLATLICGCFCRRSVSSGVAWDWGRVHFFGGGIIKWEGGVIREGVWAYSKSCARDTMKTLLRLLASSWQPHKSRTI